jgi:acyl-CoA synthetase (AMP-forming)/AMP-acid ligase II
MQKPVSNPPRAPQTQNRFLTPSSESVKNKRQCLYYLFEASVKRRPHDDCLWSREGCYTWAEAYERVNQYAQWYLAQGVKPRELVSFYLTNSPDFMFAWLGLWAIGAAPAMINYNLAGKALVHCLKVPGSKLMLVDEDEELVGRIEDARKDIEGGLGIKICVVDAAFKEGIRAMSAERPDDVYREGVQGNWPLALFYTRWVCFRFRTVCWCANELQWHDRHAKGCSLPS